MQIIKAFGAKFKSIRRRILITVSVVYLVSSGLSATWIYYEVSHEVDELFDAEMVQQAKTLAALLPVNRTELTQPAHQVLQSVSEHEYEEKLAYRIERINQDWSMRTQGAPDHRALPYQSGFNEFVIAATLWHSFGMQTPDGNYQILLLQEDSFRSELRTDLAVDTLVPVLLLLPLMLWLGWWTINQSFASFRRLAAALRHRRTDDYSPFEQSNEDEEVVLVKQALNHYLARIEQTFVREKRFSADAAHELRTPLAALKASLQNLLVSKDAIEKQQIERLLISTERLVKLVESLLMLSKAELTQVGSEPVNIAREVRQIIADSYQLAEQKGITFGVNLPDRIMHESHPSYWRVLLANIIDNAIKYSPPNTTISISYSAQILEVKNKLPTDHPLELERLTERFYRGKQLDIDGSGLGLSIVQNLAQQLAIEVEFAREDTYFICRIKWGVNA